MTEKPSDKQIEARNGLPDELKPIFDDFVADYKYAATLRHGRPYISYIVLADMIRAGWRLSAKPKPDREAYYKMLRERSDSEVQKARAMIHSQVISQANSQDKKSTP